MACPVPYTSISYVSALSKKNVKESNQWAQQQQSSVLSSSQPFPSLTSGSCKPDDDGGWSMGTPEKGSGWSNVGLYGTSSESWSPNTTETSSASGPEVGTKSEISTSSGQNLGSSNSWPFHNSGATSSHPRLAQDDIEENGRQSPGGLTMITYKEENDTACVSQEELNDWGVPKSTPSNNWKMPCSDHEKDNYPTSDWDNAELSFGENSPSLTVSNGSHTLNKDQILCQSDLEASTLDPGSVGARSRSGAGTPVSRSSGGATPTQETGGRTSAGSTSSVNSVGSSSSWKSDGKGGKTYINRLGSPRKPSRYDRSNSQSGTSIVVSEVESNNPYKARKPKKTLPELEGGLGSLRSEPSGWGELPSPKPCDVDNGTELWGVPPADQNRYLSKTASGDKRNESVRGQELRDEDSSGAVAAGWSKDNSNTVLTSRASTQWGAANEITWGSIVKDSVPSYSDNLKSIIDVKSPQHDYHKPFVDSDMLESADGCNNDKTLFHPRNGKDKKFNNGNSADGAYVYGISNSNLNEKQQGSATNQAPHSSSSGSSVQNHLFFLKLLQGSGGQQLLSQRRGQLQLHKQQLLLQMSQLNKSTGQGGGGISSVVHQQSQAISHKLTTINQMISQLNQQIMLLSQLPSQPSEVGWNSETGSPSLKVIHNPPTPVHFKTDPGSLGRSQSANAMVSIGLEPSRSLTFGVQGLSLSNPVQAGVSQSSARSMSRLQQIISGSCSADSRDENRFHSSMPIISVAQNNSFPSSFQPDNATSTSPFSSTHDGSIADSRFFFGSTSPDFTTTKSVNDIQEFKPGVPWQPKSQVTEHTQMYSKQASAPTGNSYQLSAPQQLSGGSSAQLMRSQSAVDTSCSSAVSPQSKYNQASGHLSHRMGQKAYIHGQHQPKPLLEMFSVGSGWKLKGRTIAPPSSLYPSQDFQYKPGFSTKKYHRLAGTPQSTASQRSWSSSFASVTPNSSPSSSMSHTVWGPDPGKVSNGEDAKLQGWSHGYASRNHSWLGMKSSQCRHNTASSYASPQSQTNTSSSESYTHTPVSSLTSSESTWGQDELDSLSTKQGMVSPEPTFAEWQAGKKARLSVTKLPSNPPSPWLIIRNLHSQVDEATLREMFNKYGTIQEWIVCPALECILLCYQSTDVSVPVKEHLDSNSDKLGVRIIVQYASKPDVDLISERSCEESSRSALSETIIVSTGDHLLCEDSSTTDWDSGDSHAPSSFGQQSSDSTTPGSSLWSDSGFLSGLSSPWHGSLTVPGASVVPCNSNTTSPPGNAGSEGLENCSNPSVLPFLPNDLL